MKAPPKAIGKISCFCCGEPITVKQADTGTVSVSCPDCDFSGYGRAGTEAHEKILSRLVRKDAPDPAAPKPAPAAKPPAPHPKPVSKPSTIFG